MNLTLATMLKLQELHLATSVTNILRKYDDLPELTEVIKFKSSNGTSNLEAQPKTQIGFTETLTYITDKVIIRLNVTVAL